MDVREDGQLLITACKDSLSSVREFKLRKPQGGGGARGPLSSSGPTRNVQIISKLQINLYAN